MKIFFSWIPGCLIVRSACHSAPGQPHQIATDWRGVFRNRLKNLCLTDRSLECWRDIATSCLLGTGKKSKKSDQNREYCITCHNDGVGWHTFWSSKSVNKTHQNVKWIFSLWHPIKSVASMCHFSSSSQLWFRFVVKLISNAPKMHSMIQILQCYTVTVL